MSSRSSSRQPASTRRGDLIVIGALVGGLITGAAVMYLFTRSGGDATGSQPIEGVTVTEPSVVGATTPTAGLPGASSTVPASPDAAAEQPIAPAPTAQAEAAATPAPTLAPAATEAPVTTPAPTQPVDVGPESRQIGQSVNGTPIIATRYGPADGVPVLAVGAIHGDEDDGIAITQAIAKMDPPDNVALWVIDTVNPDGVANQTRGNARGVDLNRNADGGSWDNVGEGTDRWSGPSPASEPETQATQAFLDEIRPVFSVWWHQVGNHVDDNDSVADYDLLLHYADLVGLPVIGTDCVTACVGTISGYLNDKLGSTAFVVELPASYGDDVVNSHAAAFVQVAGELGAAQSG